MVDRTWFYRVKPLTCMIVAPNLIIFITMRKQNSQIGKIVKIVVQQSSDSACHSRNQNKNKQILNKEASYSKFKMLKSIIYRNVACAKFVYRNVHIIYTDNPYVPQDVGSMIKANVQFNKINELVWRLNYFDTVYVQSFI